MASRWTGSWIASAAGLTLALALASSASRPARADDLPPAPAEPEAPLPPPAPLHPFAPWLSEVKVGAPVRLPGLILLPLEREVAVAALLPGQVTLRGAALHALDLPAPAGDLYVRLENPGALPIEALVGEALITVGGPSRIVTRPSWIPARGSALVPVALLEPTPAAPYVARGLGLSPREQELLPTSRWPQALRVRNQLFQVEERRWLDGSAAYLTVPFAFQTTPQRQVLEPLATGARVGVAVVDERGLSYVRWTADPARLRAEWPTLSAGLALDATLAVQASRAPRDQADALLVASVRDLLDTLKAAGVSKPSFGGATLTWWPTPARRGRWEGLAVDGAALSLTWRRDPAPEPPPAPAPQPPTPPPQPPKPPDPTPNQVGRDPRPTPEDERRAGRREGDGGGTRSPLR